MSPVHVEVTIPTPPAAPTGRGQRHFGPDLDDATLAGLVAGRRLHQLNLSLTLRRPGLSRYIDHAVALISEWMS